MSANPAGTTTDLNLGALTDYLGNALPDGLAGDLASSLIGGGRSNPTYHLFDGAQSWVIRRPPYGHVLPSAHDMKREYTVIDALGATAVPVPRAVHLCEDTSVLGAPFYLMELVEGIPVGTLEQASALDVDERRHLGFDLADTLAALHDIAPSAIGLGGFGRPDGYLERQLLRWSQQWDASRIVDRPEVTMLLDKLRCALPRSRFPGIVHGDVKLDNVLVAPDDRARIVSVLDWEMATLGDTLADVGIMLGFWDMPGQTPNPITRGLATLDGFPSRSEMLERYASARGIDLPNMDWYVVFADFKLAVIMEGIAARHANGDTVGDGFDGVADMSAVLLDRALDVAAASSLSELRR
ncbi:phosphotransferase family protein [Rhodococcus sp. NCIMB 12038]|uniref:phosphotransferase family protein n=1 Tax=Rhodococcus sp. NCIMB 12038 TaxID=933800 RepID=UPI000B3BFF3E|nr:phosphotransferase family protein [Rhodococcus sp. NCIMB 12038]OUS94285.1 acyl-CoA dehydrogenase [Rhodococcus sp. NCIMB 12038]